MMTDICDKIKAAKHSENIKNEKANFNPNIIPNHIPKNKDEACIARKMAFDIEDIGRERQLEWQNYWFRCCISEKCNNIFSLLRSKDVDREEDILKICDNGSKLWDALDDDRRKRRLDLSIDFFLRRYNLFGAWKLYKRYPPNINIYINVIINTNLIKFALPRMFSTILIGFLPIITSSEIRDFAEIIPLKPILYCILIFIIIIILGPFSYFLLECNKTTRGTLVNKSCNSRGFSILLFSLAYSFSFSYIFTIIGLLGSQEINPFRITFYAIVALLIGILIQLLWEDKTASEPI